ncbi:MAG TPA: hypothetical protein PLZ16_16500 [Gammaproteobacteria bacterium]|nr:hypothetical protein [Gammaproteobacteria bacterium]
MWMTIQTFFIGLVRRFSSLTTSWGDWLRTPRVSSWMPVVAGSAVAMFILSIGVIVDVWWFWFLVIPAAIALGGLAFILVFEKVR